MIPVASKDKESTAWPAADQLAVPDDDEATGRGPLASGFSTAGLHVGRCGAGDDDEAVADPGLVHGEPCSGDGQQGLGVVYR